jgi:hypothetical protein
MGTFFLCPSPKEMQSNEQKTKNKKKKRNSIDLFVHSETAQVHSINNVFAQVNGPVATSSNSFLLLEESPEMWFHQW